jgi:hypothetical protein
MVRLLAKPGIVIAGYVVAMLIANAAVNARLVHHSADAQNSPGMYAWGDLILFLEVFGLAAIIPTGLALYFLRPIRIFWPLFSLAAVAFAVTGTCAFAADALWSRLPPHSLLGLLAAIGGLREMLSPAAAVIFLLAIFAAPGRRPRLILLVATIIEAPLGIYSFHQWFAPFNVHSAVFGCLFCS